jgi:hypothetical protein
MPFLLAAVRSFNRNVDIKMFLSFYRIGGVLTLEIRIKTRRSSLTKLLIPLPMICLARLDRS